MFSQLRETLTTTSTRFLVQNVMTDFLTILFDLVQNYYFGTMQAFHKFRYDFPSGDTRSPQLVLRAFHNLRLVSSTALSLYFLRNESKIELLYQGKEFVAGHMSVNEH